MSIHGGSVEHRKDKLDRLGFGGIHGHVELFAPCSPDETNPERLGDQTIVVLTNNLELVELIFAYQAINEEIGHLANHLLVGFGTKRKNGAAQILQNVSAGRKTNELDHLVTTALVHHRPVPRPGFRRDSVRAVTIDAPSHARRDLCRGRTNPSSLGASRNWVFRGQLARLCSLLIRPEL